MIVILAIFHKPELLNPGVGAHCGYGIIEDVSRSLLGAKYNENRVAYYLEHSRYRDKVTEGPNACSFNII
jgi:hypothetical protein